MAKFNSNRNFGFGKQMAFAGRNALRESYGAKEGTINTYSAKWKQACEYFRTEEEIRDVKDINTETIERYAENLLEKVISEEMTVSYAQGLLSACNNVLNCLRGDDAVKVSPSELVGKRDNVRTETPAGLDRESVEGAAEKLREVGHKHVASIVELARDFGIRLKEATLIDCHKALRQAEQKQIINIREGTKGGRGKYIAREVPVSSKGMETLIRAAKLQGQNRNLIPQNFKRIQFVDQIQNQWKQIRSRFGLRRIHDLRAAYACQRYREIAQKDAPAVAGQRRAEKTDDKNARSIISQELGHGVSRQDVTAAYLGSAK